MHAAYLYLLRDIYATHISDQRVPEYLSARARQDPVPPRLYMPVALPGDPLQSEGAGAVARGAPAPRPTGGPSGSEEDATLGMMHHAMI